MGGCVSTRVYRVVLTPARGGVVMRVAINGQPLAKDRVDAALFMVSLRYKGFLNTPAGPETFVRGLVTRTEYERLGAQVGKYLAQERLHCSCYRVEVHMEDGV